jgi:hypothetical protein
MPLQNRHGNIKGMIIYNIRTFYGEDIAKKMPFSFFPTRRHERKRYLLILHDFRIRILNASLD